MLKVLTKEEERIVLNGGDIAVNFVQLKLNEARLAFERKLFDEQVENKEEVRKLKKDVDDAKNGKEKILTATQVVKELNIEGLTTTMLNKWLVSRDLGYYKRFNNDKKRTFQPNQNFMTYIAEEGYSLTGHTVDGMKIKVLYSWNMLHRINDLYREDIVNFLEETL